MKGNFTKILILALLLIVYYFLSVNMNVIINYISYNIYNLNSLAEYTVITLIYFIFLLFVYFIYKDEITSDFRRFKRNIFPNIILAVLYFMVLVIIMFVINYLLSLVKVNFRLVYNEISFNNILEFNYDAKGILFIIKNLIIIPFIQIYLFIIATKNIVNKKNNHHLVAGLLAFAFNALILGGSFLFSIYNASYFFILFYYLTYIYRKNHTNITYTFITAFLYNLFAGYITKLVLK